MTDLNIDVILAKKPEEITEEEFAFLRENKSDLPVWAQNRFAEQLGGETNEQNDGEEQKSDAEEKLEKIKQIINN